MVRCWHRGTGTTRLDRQLPVSEGGPAGEEQGLRGGQWLVQQAEEGVILHTVLPEALALVPGAHQEVQRVLVRPLGGHRRRCYNIDQGNIIITEPFQKT